MSEVAVAVVREVPKSEPSVPEPDSNVVEVLGRSINLGLAVPLKTGDWRRIKAAGVDVMKLMDGGKLNVGIDELCAIVDYALRKADPGLPANFVDDLDLPDLSDLAAKIMSANAAAGKKVDRPT